MWGAVTPGPGRLVFPRAWQSCFFGVLVPGWLLWDDARSRVLGGTGRAKGFIPVRGARSRRGSAGVAEVWCREEEEEEDGRRSQGVAQVMLLPAAVGARTGWEVTCPPLEEIWGRSRTLNDG